MFYKYHPLIVHFPIALLLCASILSVIGLFHRRGLFKEMIYWILLMGVISCLLAIYTGLEDEKEVVGDYKVKELLQTHKRNAFILTGLFTMLLLWISIRKRRMRIMEYCAWSFFLVLGGFSVAYQGHLGASMVYQQGTGIKALKENRQKLKMIQSEKKHLFDRMNYF